MNGIDDYSVAIGKQISLIRNELGLTQKQLAKELNISQQLIANYELGQRRIHVSLLVKLAEVLHINVDELLGLNKRNKPGPMSKIERKIEFIKTLPEDKQKKILELIDSAIEIAS